MKKILVTGASGFIGNALCNRLFKSNYVTYGVVRNSSARLSDNNFNQIPINEINSNRRGIKCPQGRLFIGIRPCRNINWSSVRCQDVS